MKRSIQPVLIAALVVALTLSLSLSLRAVGGAAPKQATIAVVDVQKVFSALQERGDLEAEITVQTERLQKEEQDRQQDLKAMQSDLALLNPDADAFKTKRDQLENKAIEFQVWKQVMGRKLENEKTMRIEQLYGKVIDAIERMAKKGNVDLVLYKDQTEKLTGQNQQQLAAMIQVRKCLYASSDLDLTDQIAQTLNNEFANRKGAKPAPTPAPGAPKSNK